MSIAVVVPRFEHPAIEERFASWQTQLLLRSGRDHDKLVFYSIDEEAGAVAADVEADHLLVVTDPLLLPSFDIGARLRDVLAASGAEAAVPVTNAATNPHQQRNPPSMYTTLRELQVTFEAIEREPMSHETVTWDGSDPGIFLCDPTRLLDSTVPLGRFLQGRRVAVSRTDYVHRWASMRGQVRHDLLSRIPTDARSILEFGCGEATLGAELKRRQKCRVVGIELDLAAAAIARKRIDEVYTGDVRELVEIIQDRFDSIIGGDIVEHLDDPWSFLTQLRQLAAPDAQLLLSLPNLANAGVVGDLLQGRFDYIYMGLTCAGHLRFFTRSSIEDMLAISGWTVESITAQEAIVTPAQTGLMAALERAGIAFSREDLTAPGYYVVARNR
ncbi:MAG: class I SAM-dependent methyltransferase [Thermoanaerobaculia bacterium]